MCHDMKRTTMTLLAVATMVSLTACSNDGDSTALVTEPTEEYTVDSVFAEEEPEAPEESPTADKTPAPKNGPVETVTGFLEALANTNIGQACENVTDEFIEQVRFEHSVTEGSGCAETITALVMRDGVPTEWRSAKPVLADSKARTASVALAPTVALTVVKKAGVWVIDSDARSDWTKAPETDKKTKKPKKKPAKPGKNSKSDGPKAPKPSKDTTPSQAPDPEPTPVNIDREGAARWVPNWCSLTTTMSKATVISFMGEPTSTFGPDSSQPQVRWANDKIKFTAFLKGNRVWQLQADYSGATASQKRVLTCDEVRR